MQAVTTIGLDIAKSVFQIHGVDAGGNVIVRRQLKCRYVLPFFQKLPPCLVGIEACASSHHWSRELQAIGHTVRLMPPAYVKPHVKRHKNDAADAEAICDAVLAAKTVTTRIPIVFLMGGDPVKLGLVVSLNRPGGNLTGITTLNTEITPKRVEILRELVPTTTIMAVLVNPTNNPANVEVELRQAEVAATLGLQTIHVLQEHRARPGWRLLHIDPAAGRRARDHRRYIVIWKKRAARRFGISPLDADDFSVSRVRDGRGPDELRRQCQRTVPPGWRLYRARPQRREPG
jgi:hypothetical protein